MSKVLMSINPIHAEKILAGTKKYEFRKVRCKKQIEVIVIYATAPIMKVLGEVKVKEVIEDSLQAVWDKTKTAAGIDLSFFNRYYQRRKKAVAYELGDVTIFTKPKNLSDYGLKVAPQSYAYVK
ncbi:MAG: hypothetical protein IJX38_02585 [Clostridia bacterium]|nr:hypothetical protein [Clostridia bacterium]